MQSKNGTVQHKDALKKAKKNTADYQYKTNRLIRLFLRFAPYNKADLHLTVGKHKL